MKNKKSILDVGVLLIVVAIAGIIIALSFGNTAKLAGELGLNPYLTAGLVEILFASLLFLRGRQRATQRNVPAFLEIGYFTSLAFVTAVNMYGLSLVNPWVGSIVGVAISAAMWLMESVLVWLWVDSDKPYTKSVKERMRDAKRDIEEEKAIQRIEWMKWEARNPDLKLIQAARKAEEKRKSIVGDELPEFFRQLQQPEPPQEVTATTVTVPIQVEPKKEETAAIVPLKRQIGFHPEVIEAKEETVKQDKNHLFKPNTDARAKAIETASQLKEELGRVPTKKELMEAGLSDHYARIAKKSIDTK